MIKPEIIALLKTGSFCVALTGRYEDWRKDNFYDINKKKILHIH